MRGRRAPTPSTSRPAACSRIPLNPPGEFAFETITATYDAMISSGVYGLRNYFLFRYPVLRPIFRWLWYRMKRGLPVEGVSLDEARAIKAAVGIPVINTGGWQTRLQGPRRDRLRCHRRRVDRALAGRQPRPRPVVGARARPAAEKPCTYCNRCLLNAPKNPMGCYEPLRFVDHDAMVEQLMTIYRAQARAARAQAGGGLSHAPGSARHRRPGGSAPPAPAHWPAVPLYVVCWSSVGLLGRAGRGLRRSGGCSQDRTPHYADIVEHFKYGSIGSEPRAGFPTGSGRRCRVCSPRSSSDRTDYSAFGFLYEPRPDGRQRDLPIGIGRREVDGVELVWFNCATCHTGTVRAARRTARATSCRRCRPTISTSTASSASCSRPGPTSGSRRTG